MKILNIYGQYDNHKEVRIVGNRLGLEEARIVGNRLGLEALKQLTML